VLFSVNGQANGLDDYNKISRGSALLITYALNNKLLALEDIYTAISEEYKNTANEFERRKLAKQYEADTLAYISGVRKVNMFYVDIPITLPEYDFNRQGFLIKEPSSINPIAAMTGDGTYFTYDSTKAGAVSVDFDNYRGEQFFPMSVAEAEKLAPQLSTSRSSVLSVYGTLGKVDRTSNLFGSMIHLHMQGKLITLKLESGEELGKLTMKVK
jgi:hypothetical protein